MHVHLCSRTCYGSCSCCPGLLLVVQSTFRVHGRPGAPHCLSCSSPRPRAARQPPACQRASVCHRIPHFYSERRMEEWEDDQYRADEHEPREQGTWPHALMSTGIWCEDGKTHELNGTAVASRCATRIDSAGSSGSEYFECAISPSESPNCCCSSSTMHRLNNPADI